MLSLLFQPADITSLFGNLDYTTLENLKDVCTNAQMKSFDCLYQKL